MTLSYQLDNLLRNELKPGERLLWHGQPVHKIRFVVKYIPLIIFGLLFNGVPTTALIYLMLQDGFYFGLFIANLFWCLIGFCFLLLPCFAWLRAGRTVYAITTNRAFSFTQGFFGGVDFRAFTPRMLRDISRKQFSNGGGDLIFTYHITHYKGGTRRIPYGFLGISDVSAVEHILYKMRDENLFASNQGGEA